MRTERLLVALLVLTGLATCLKFNLRLSPAVSNLIDDDYFSGIEMMNDSSSEEDVDQQIMQELAPLRTSMEKRKANEQQKFERLQKNCQRLLVNLQKQVDAYQQMIEEAKKTLQLADDDHSQAQQNLKSQKEVYENIDKRIKSEEEYRESMKVAHQERIKHYEDAIKTIDETQGLLGGDMTSFTQIAANRRKIFKLANDLSLVQVAKYEQNSESADFRQLGGLLSNIRNHFVSAMNDERADKLEKGLVNTMHGEKYESMKIMHHLHDRMSKAQDEKQKAQESIEVNSNLLERTLKSLEYTRHDCENNSQQHHQEQQVISKETDDLFQVENMLSQ
eukprot:TRINITY_DN485_c0_g3_i4.p1 TRINITY_DN485_c0_g3~~TRINITY_DN485_c0_g3_i4.p1  ORF type:complete len:334 (-),score=103.12 TRINITY_DN485_c0_g3_i4:149-1150(-)